MTVLCLGPLTNVARALQRDPQLCEMVDRFIIVGGAVKGIGNVTPVAEFNMHYDAGSAREVLRSPTTKTLIPLDVTEKVRFSFDFVQELPKEFTRAGAFLRRILPYAFRAHHQQLGQESIRLHGIVGLVAAIHPELFETEELAGDVEVGGDLTCGMTVFDRRDRPQWRSNMDVATGIDAVAIKDCVVRGLRQAGDCT